MAERPHLMAALLCERVLAEKDEVLSAIRIVDTFYVTVPKNRAPEIKPTVQITMLLGFKKRVSDQAEKHLLTLRSKAPSGSTEQQPTIDLNFKADTVAGANLIANLQLGVKEFGVFQIEVMVDDTIVTVVPFRLLERAEMKLPTIH